MIRCPSCGAEVRGQKKFCGVCGVPIAEAAPLPPGPSSGTSTVRLDADGLNMILREVSNHDRQLTFQGGKLHLAQGPIQGLVGLQLGLGNLEASVTYTGGMGALHVSLETLQLDEQGLEISFRLSR